MYHRLLNTFMPEGNSSPILVHKDITNLFFVNFQNLTMKNLFIFLTFFVGISLGLQAQNTCCLPTTVAPAVTSGIHGMVIPVNQSTPVATLVINASADLPNVEYLITKRGTPALDQNGQPTGDDVIIGASVNGAFIPSTVSRYGVILNPGDTCDITAVGFDLALMQTLTDSLLNGTNSSGQPCCNLFSLLAVVLSEPSIAAFCTTLNNAGISRGSDVQDLGDVLTIFDALSTTGQTTVPSVLATLQLLNNNGTFIGPDCGGVGMNNFLPYGMVPTNQYSYAIGNAGMPTGQTVCCLPTTVAPEVLPGIYGTPIATNQNTVPPPLAVNASADLPNVEYLITKRGTSSLDQNNQPTGQDVVLGADVDGIFMPMDPTRYGISLSVGDTFELTAIGYDLAQLQTLTDSLLNGKNLAGTPCCNLFILLAAALNEPSVANFCSNVNNAGIAGGNDVQDMTDVLTIFDAMSTTGQLSIESLIATIQLLNANGTVFQTDCGGAGANDFISFGINPTKRYGYEMDNALVVQALNPVTRFLMYPNPASDRVQLHVTTDQPVELTINVYDVLGQRVMSRNLGQVQGDYNTGLSVGHLAKGIYAVEITNGQERQTHKLTIQ